MVEKGKKQGARLLVIRARLAQCTAERHLGDPKAAIPFCQEAQQLAAETGDRFGLAMAMNNTANVLYDQGEVAAARKMYEAARGEYRKTATCTGWREHSTTSRASWMTRATMPGQEKPSEQALAIYRIAEEAASALH
jgi:hypothetical protein